LCATSSSPLQHLHLGLVAPSLGGVETLVTRPVLTTHVGLTPAEREAVGIADGLIRVSVGIEDADDLVADFLGALDAAAAEVPNGA
jgi:cystathionine gamma-synthase